MKSHFPFILLKLSAIVAVTIFTVGTLRAQQSVDFNREIRPILADACFRCHGPDAEDRHAGLRLDQRVAVIDEFQVVVPGDVEGSELYRRITSDDQNTLMPPPDSGRRLNDEQKELIRRWIEEGADWQRHWSFIPPQRETIPEIRQKQWVTNSIDSFVLAGLEQARLSPQPESERHTLIRRVALDLTGLPPSPAIIKKYQENSASDWYEQLVDELLTSEHYGEHMARYWLDAARYGDTHGLHLDNYREMWPYRDWVVEAFNQNKPFDDFVVEQLAGDLLEQPTQKQLIASGFNRAHVTTNEGGSIVEEVNVRNVVDRVSTAGTVFLGLTVGCAQCHDHKFDPISQREFYQMFAFFNNLADDPMDQNIKDPHPVLVVASEAQQAQLKSLEVSLQAAKTNLEKMLSEYQYVDDEKAQLAGLEDVEQASDRPVEQYIWVDDVLPVGAKPAGQWDFVAAGKAPVYSGNTSRLAVAEDRMIQHYFTGASPLRVVPGDRFFAMVYLDPADPPAEIMLQFNDGGWEHRVFWGDDKIDWGASGQPSRLRLGDLPETGKWVELDVPVEAVGFKKLSLINGMAFTQWGGKAHWDAAGVYTSLEQSREFTSLSHWLRLMRSAGGEGLPELIKNLTVIPDDELDADQRQDLRDYFLTDVHPQARELFAEPVKQIDVATKSLERFKKSLPTTLISKEKEQVKAAFLLLRGEYDQRGEQVERATPAALSPFPLDAPKNRLGLAQWIVAPENPLTARVTVNRFWQQVFGTGIVKTADDFGAQGDVPSHPDLLDWLAVEFIESGWDAKRLMKTIVMSSTYRQSSRMSPELISRDPENRLLARGPRFRLDAEVLRDQALAVSGLLVREIGGPSLKPPQPDGLWFAVGYSGSNTVRFKKDDGPEKVHRRSLYTFWKRTSPPPQMSTFDAPSRESCSVRRERTNTPLQALLLMNDPQYVEAARVFAQNAIEAAEAPDERARMMYRTALGRVPTDQELAILIAQYESDNVAFKKNPADARKLLQIGEVAADEKYDAIELATWTMMASLIMNTDEFVNKN